MAALVQSYPQQSGTVTMLQTRPSSAGGMGQPHGSSQYDGSQQRASFHGHVGGATTYRGSSAPIQPYAFTSTPSLNSNAQWQQYGGLRTSSTPAVPTMQQFDGVHGPERSRYPAAASMSSLSSMSTFTPPTGYARDDSSLPVTGRRVASATSRPQSTYLSGSSAQLQFPAPAPAPAKASPERYRRPPPRVIDSSAVTTQSQGQGMVSSPSSGMTTLPPHLYNSRALSDQQTNGSWNKSSALSGRPNSFYAAVPATTVDDMQLYKHSTESKRFRRRSMPTLDSADFLSALTPPHLKQAEEGTRQEQLAQQTSGDRDQKSARAASARSVGENLVHSRTGSSESVVSTRSSNNSRPSSSTNRNSNVSIPAGNPASQSPVLEQRSAVHESPRLVNIPPRGSSSDAAKRVTNPSPLSRPVTMDTDQAASSSTTSAPGASPSQPANSPSKPESPAVRQLAAINQKGKAKSKTSRLRRAFSFGSVAELKKITNADEDAGASASSNGPSKLHKEPTAEELYDAEQARIAQKQEEAGIGSSIYAGARIFAGSTDNLSISSTASSASIMIRKMGRGMKKGGRSLVGLFRPKSVIGVPAADGPVLDASQPAVSMITVEAERERVNVNPDPHTQNGGGTGFPRLERNSIDASKAPSYASERVGSSGTDASVSRKSIVGGEKERAEVLAAVRKGILKNTSGSSSPARTPNENSALELPNIPRVTDSPNSSAPSTPNDECHGHKRNGSVAIGSEDYFMSALRLRQDTKSAPGTPQGGAKRNATFSPRIIFYDTWPSQEYDRRGDIATCNRLTPMLAQQIKEELNSFKMEMEVHENSKIYTHFF